MEYSHAKVTYKFMQDIPLPCKSLQGRLVLESIQDSCKKIFQELERFLCTRHYLASTLKETMYLQDCSRFCLKSYVTLQDFSLQDILHHIPRI